MPSPWYRGWICCDRRRSAYDDAPSCHRAGIAIEDAVVLTELLASELPAVELLDRFMTRRLDHCRLVVETALKLGDMEKDTSIPFEAHLDLMAATFRQLAAPI